MGFIVQAFLAETVEKSLLINATHVCEESLGKIKFRAFPKRVDPRILSLESVDYFGTSEHYWVVETKNNNLNQQNSDFRVL